MQRRHIAGIMHINQSIIAMKESLTLSHILKISLMKSGHKSRSIIEIMSNRCLMSTIRWVAVTVFISRMMRSRGTIFSKLSLQTGNIDENALSQHDIDPT